jgi:hypothetical protein
VVNLVGHLVDLWRGHHSVVNLVGHLVDLWKGHHSVVNLVGHLVDLWRGHHSVVNLVGHLVDLWKGHHSVVNLVGHLEVNLELYFLMYNLHQVLLNSYQKHQLTCYLLRQLLLSFFFENYSLLPLKHRTSEKGLIKYNFAIMQV